MSENSHSIRVYVLSPKFYWIFFVNAFLQQFTRNLVLLGTLLLVIAVLFLKLGGEFGIPLLFWNENPWQALLAGTAVVLLLGKLFYVGFLLDANRPRDGVRRWLKACGLTEESDSMLQCGFYLLGSFVTLCFFLLLGAAIWELVSLLKIFQDNKGIAANVVLPQSFLPFAGGAALGGLIIIGIWWSVNFSLDHLNGPWMTAINRMVLLGTHDAPDREQLHLVAAFFTAILAVGYLWGMIFLPDKFGTAATALCTSLGLLVGVYGAAVFQFRDRGFPPVLLLLGLILLLIFGGLPQYKARVLVLSDLYGSKLANLEDYQKSERPCGLFRNGDPTWAVDGKPQPLVIVCVSGGGIRAAVWAASVMHVLEQDPGLHDFPYHVRIISGASGGMVGMALYTASLNSPDEYRRTGRFHKLGNDDGAVADDLAKDSLSRTTKQMIFRDAPRLLVPIPSSFHRGQTLEDQWQQAWGNCGNATFGDLVAGEAKGWRPSLIVSPMLIEDGRRLLISNLDLDFMTHNLGDRLDMDPPGNLADDDFFSRPAYEFSRLFQDRLADFPVRTAARLNASFPYVTPAPMFPTRPRRRVADAGYYDNYGVSIASTWLTQYLARPDKTDWLRKEVSGVVLIQIRDGISDLAQPDAKLDQSEGTPLSRGLEWLTTPIDGLLSARESVTRFRNDNQIVRVGQLFKKTGFKDGYFTTATFEFGGQASLSWYLTHTEKQALINTAAALPNADNLPNGDHQIKNLEQWWNDPQQRKTVTTQPTY